MKIRISIETDQASVSADFATDSIDPHREARRVLARLFRTIGATKPVLDTNLFLNHTQPHRVHVIQAVRDVLGIGLKAAQELVDSVCMSGLPLARHLTSAEVTRWEARLQKAEARFYFSSSKS